MLKAILAGAVAAAILAAGLWYARPTIEPCPNGDWPTEWCGCETPIYGDDC